MNKQITDQFDLLIEQIKYDIDNSPSKKERMINYFRLQQLQKAIKIISEYPQKIKAGADLEDIKGIGKGTISRIDEILKTGKLSEIKKKTGKQLKQQLIIDELEKVIGIGRIKAMELINKYNISSIDDLKKISKSIDLPHQIQVGLKYHNVYQQNIPRAEIDSIKTYLKDEIHHIDPKIHLEICGSYRRKKTTSNDIDVLIVHPDIKTPDELEKRINYLAVFTKRLTNKKFLVDDLTDKEYRQKYMGFCKFQKNPIRRIDIRYFPFESYPSALLYFTGSGGFNKRMRSLAIDLGYKLNEYGLFNKDTGERVQVSSERDIFDALGMEFLEPEQRID